MPAVTGAAIGIPTLGSKVLAGLGTAGKFLSGLGGIAGALGFGSGGDRSNLERHAILRRVRDAQEAGIHPLFALGASVGYSPIIDAGSKARGTQATGDFLQSLARDAESKRSAGLDAQIQAAQLRALNAQSFRDESAAQLSLSEIARNNAVLNGSGVGRGPVVEDELLGTGSYALEPGRSTAARSSDPAVEAGQPGGEPAFRELRYGNSGRTIRVPSQSQVETAEGISYILMALDWIDRNIRIPSTSPAKRRANEEKAAALNRWIETLPSRIIDKVKRDWKAAKWGG